MLWIGILESIAPALRQKVTLIAMCFPTTRDRITDRANAIFDEHVNLPTKNKYNMEYNSLFFSLILH